MNVATLVGLVKDGIREQTLSTQKALDYINLAQDDLEQMAWWRHLEAYPPALLTILGPESTGTATFTQNSVDVVGVGTAFTSAHVGQVIQRVGDSNYYWVASVSDATHLKLSVAYATTTSAAASFVITTVKATLPSNLSMPKIKSIVIQNPFYELQNLDETERIRRQPSIIATTGQPTRYTPLALDTILFYPVPNATYLLELRYQLAPTPLTSADVDASNPILWPAAIHRTLQKLAIAEGWREKGDDDQADTIEQQALARAQMNKKNNAKRADYTPKLRGFDEGRSTNTGPAYPTRVTGDPLT